MRSLMLSLYRFSIALCAVRFSPRGGIAFGQLANRFIGTLSLSTICRGMFRVVRAIVFPWTDGCTTDWLIEVTTGVDIVMMLVPGSDLTSCDWMSNYETDSHELATVNATLTVRHVHTYNYSQHKFVHQRTWFTMGWFVMSPTESPKPAKSKGSHTRH